MSEATTLLDVVTVLIERGIYKLPVNLKRNHISLSHSQADIDETLEKADEVMGTLS